MHLVTMSGKKANPIKPALATMQLQAPAEMFNMDYALGQLMRVHGVTFRVKGAEVDVDNHPGEIFLKLEEAGS